jgi:hypothetical protein
VSRFAGSMKSNSPSALAKRCRKEGVPTPVEQYRIAPGLTAAACWPESDLLVFLGDVGRRRLNKAAVAGWRVLAFSAAEWADGALRVVKRAL